MSKKPVVLMILDGYGLNEKKEGNAVAMACTTGGIAECYVSSGGRASTLGTCRCGSRRDLGILLA